MLSSMTTSLCRTGHSIRQCAALILCGAAAIAGGCATGGATQFKTPDAAVGALVSALRSNNEDELHRILGPESGDLLSSGDEVADANGRAQFLKLYDQKHRLESRDPDSVTLDVGDTDWPLPIPIVKGDKGWSFDTAAGLDEMLSRRIGRNELSAIQVCLAIGDAQREYAAADSSGDGWREYATKFKSDAGKKDGLYWPTESGEAPSPLGDLVATATEEGYTTEGRGPEHPKPYHGYYYRILTGQGEAAPGGAMSYIAQGHMMGGFGVVAWPADYANSGLKTFISSHHGGVYQKDLGEDTDKIARGMTLYNPGPGWERCEPEKEGD